jgi:RNA polymerase sigma-70 factor (ECF subfamily)
MKPTEKISDEALVQKSLKNIDHFGTLVERYEAKLLRYVLRLSNLSYEECEEVLQEVFLKVWRNLREFDQNVKFSSWIYRITHNETISTFRKKQSRGQDTQAELSEDLFIPQAGNFVEDLDQKLSAEQIQIILKSLPKKYQEVLILKFFEDQSYEEMSDILKKPSGTIATLINRAKKSFRQAVERNESLFTAFARILAFVLWTLCLSRYLGRPTYKKRLSALYPNPPRK